MSRIWARRFSGGADPARALEALTPADVAGLKEGMQRYGLLLNDAGQHQGRFHATRLAGEAALYLVVNAGTKEGDFAYIAEALKGVATLTPQPDRALLALQGPLAAEVLERHAPGHLRAHFHAGRCAPTVAGAPAIVSRTGYTGEDGFEISLEGKDAERVARALLGEAEVLPIGLGARDSLRLEAGLCLYGHDMDETHRSGGSQSHLVHRQAPQGSADFPGADRSWTHLLNGAAQEARRHPARRPCARARRHRDRRQIRPRHRPRHLAAASAPASMRPLAMGYVESEFAANGTKLDLMVRGKAMPARVAPMPFVPHRYKRASKSEGVGS